MRAGMVLLGLALGILWIVGLSYGATPWLVWLDFAAAVIALGSVLVPENQKAALRAAPFAIGVGLLALWVIGLVAGSVSWMVWWTFAFGIAFLLLGASVNVGEVTTPTTTSRADISGPHPA